MANSKATGVAYSDPAIDGGTVDNTPIGDSTRSSGKFTTLSSTGTSTIGDAAGDLVSFHGATAVDQSAIAGASVSNAPVSLSGFGVFSSCAAVSNLIASHNAMLACLVEKGLMAAS